MKVFYSTYSEGKLAYNILGFELITSHWCIFPVIADIRKAVKETSFRLLDAFVDFVFEFVDQPLLPSHVHFHLIVPKSKNSRDFPKGLKRHVPQK